MLGHPALAREENLNLMTATAPHRIMARHLACRFKFAPTRLFGWTSNLVLMIEE